MTKTEIPSGDSGEQAPPETKPAVKSGSDEKVTKASNCERVWIWVLLVLVVIGAIAGLTTTLVLEARKRARIEKNKHNNHYNHDDYFYDDSHNYYDDYYGVDDDAWGTSIETNPFEVDVSHFSSDAAESYTSVEDLRADVELLGKVLVNSIILQEANSHIRNKDHHYYDDWGPVFAEDMARPSVAASEGYSSKDSASPENFFRGMDDFETYQHEAGAVKDDIVKSDGVYVYAAVDDRIERWDLEGNLLESIQITSGHSWGDTVYINALLMNPEGTRLVAIGSDYYGHSRSNLVEKGETLVNVFDIEGGSFVLLSRKNVDGYHSTSYSVGNNVHVVTKSSLNTWRFLEDQLNLYKFNDAQNNEEYVEAAKAAAEEWIIPHFVDAMVDLVSNGDEIYLSPIVGYPDGYKSLTQVYSFDVSEVATKEGLDDITSKSMALGPGHTGYVYATSGWLWVLDETWAWGRGSLASSTETTLLGFRLDGASTSFAATTTIPGQLLSQFSIDFVQENGKEFARIAITQNSFDVWWEPRPFPMPMPVDTAAVDEAEDEDETESSTLNEIIIFEVPSAESNTFQMTRLGSVEVGKKDETVTAVRFFDNLSYVVTFERTDPFYVLDLSDPENPSVLGELEVPGFSEFMHPINADNSMLITVGQDANEFGVVTGFQISIFDSTTPSDPKLVDRLVIEGGSSSASWDERAFRYIQVGDVGRLIIPLYQYDHDRFGNSVNNMDGFTVFGVDLSKTEEMITRELDINHYEEYTDRYDDRGCYCGGVWLPKRSLVFDGNVMTMKNSLVTSTDLGSGETLWSLTLQKHEDCCNY